jgi:hypothetical protein
MFHYRDTGVSPQIKLKMRPTPGDQNDTSPQKTLAEKFKSHFLDTIKKAGPWQALDWDAATLGDLVAIATDMGSSPVTSSSTSPASPVTTPASTHAERFQTDATLYNRKYTPDLENPASPYYQSLEAEVCQAVSTCLLRNLIVVQGLK